MKKIIYALVGLVIVIVIAVVVLFDSIGRITSEQYATQLLKTPVKISQFNASFFKKSVNIDFVEVKNLPNFKSKNAFSLNHFSLKVGDISDDLIVIDELIFDGLEFVLEQNDSSVNLTQFIDNLSQAESGQSDDVDSNASINEKRIKVGKFRVDNIVLKVDTQLLKTDVDVPNISMSNFGGDSGVGTSQFGQKITEEILQRLKKALEKKGIEAGKEKIKETLIRKIGSKLGLENLQKTIDTDNIKDSIGSGYENVKEKVKEQFDDKLKDQAKDLFKGLGF